MNQINIQSELLNRIMELAKELKITPFAEKLNTMVLNGELEITSKSVEEIILELLETTSKEREESQLAKSISRLGLHNPTANLNNILWNIGRKGISKRELSELSTCDWIRCRRNLILLGATGVGKTRIADTLAITALQAHFKVFYRRASLFVSELRELDGNEEIRAYLKMLGKYDLIYIDDFASGHLDPLGESMLCEIADEICDKYKASLMITTQHDIESWLKNYFYSAANGEAFVDRVYTPAIKFDLDGPTLRVNIFQSPNNGTPVSNGTELQKKETGSTGGKTESDSSILVPKRKRGRPRKNPVTDCNGNNLSDIQKKGTNVHMGTGTDNGNRGTGAKDQTAKVEEEMNK
ncbi:MAG: ATP-binding protein [Succinivibrio dextrinosolvens]|nr:ATP-binding protein [Succinivibrio dextrinosolvens]MDY6419346.1 ATP-binding protein [Succinivibrio dextrinosolvens]